MLYAVQKINGSALWANLNLLFWLSLVPFVTDWMGENHFSKWPVVLYGVILIMNGISYNILVSLLVKYDGSDSALAKALRKDRKGKLSVMLYATGIVLAFFNSWIAFCLYIVVAVIWFIPDRRIEKTIGKQ
ncbi:MAG: hypothetical protein P4L51_12130 [Puia sp.]|nr:hypothetical protein [Puia sp.]